MFLKLFTHNIGCDQIVSPLLWTILPKSNDIIIFPIKLVLIENDFSNHFQRNYWIYETSFQVTMKNLAFNGIVERRHENQMIKL
jgi:hypothetical protein